jgi:hypothetical protein
MRALIECAIEALPEHYRAVFVDSVFAQIDALDQPSPPKAT